VQPELISVRKSATNTLYEYFISNTFVKNDNRIGHTMQHEDCTLIQFWNELLQLKFPSFFTVCLREYQDSALNRPWIYHSKSLVNPFVCPAIQQSICSVSQSIILSISHFIHPTIYLPILIFLINYSSPSSFPILGLLRPVTGVTKMNSSIFSKVFLNFFSLLVGILE
jgi:hypothetical protein